MNVKTKKILFELSKNSRISNKLLSKKIRSSPQSTSYLVKQFEKKKKIINSYELVVDPVKLGYLNIVVGFNYLNLSNDVIKEINDFFKNNPYVINMQECSQGVDLVIEYCQNNLSAFNKSYSEFIDKFSGFIDTKFIFPVIVKHEYLRKYLSRNVGSSDMVLCGDKEIPVLSIREKSVLFHLMKDPLSSFTALAKRTGLSTRAVVELKKSLERKKVVRGYTCSFNLSGTQIRKELLFLRLTNKTFIQINKLTEFAKQNVNVVNLIKLIGDYHLLLVIESLKEIDILSRIRLQFEVEDYLVVPVKKILTQKFVPLIEI